MDRVLRAASAASVILLAAGLALWLGSPAGTWPELVLNWGLVLLMASPVMRLTGALREEIRAREWRFAALGFAVLVLLACSLAISF